MHLFTGSFVQFLASHGITILSWILVVAALLAYGVLRPGRKLERVMRWSLLVAGVVSLVMAILLTTAQYATWAGTDFGRLLLPPTQPWSYFAFYAWQHFWLASALALLCAALWYGFMRLIKSRSERYLDEGELELTTLMVFAAGWPGVVVLLPLAGIFLVLVSIARLLVLKRELTTLGLPIMLSAILTLVFADAIRVLFGY